MPPISAAGTPSGGAPSVGAAAPFDADAVDVAGSPVFVKSLYSIMLPELTTNEEKGGSAVPVAVGVGLAVNWCIRDIDMVLTFTNLQGLTGGMCRCRCGCCVASNG
jgi:hypothetical protein